MKRIILVLTVTATMLAMMVAGGALPALATHETGDDSGRPDNPQCGWYENRGEGEEWWEYWCWWPHWGWEFVFWTW